MTYLWIAIGVVAWLACGVFAYLIFKSACIWDTKAWRRSDRVKGLLYAMVGPSMVIYILGLSINMLIEKIANRPTPKWRDDTPAKW